MRNYQRTRNNPYLLPHHLYMRTLYIIRDYERLKQKSEEHEKGELKDIVCHRAAAETKAIENALLCVPSFYRNGVFENITDGAKYPTGADERTFRRYKQRYVYHVARLLDCI